jgi:hypothetical protein
MIHGQQNVKFTLNITLADQLLSGVTATSTDSLPGS